MALVRGGPGGDIPGWARRAGAGEPLYVGVEAREAARTAIAHAGCVLIDAGAGDPVRLAQRIRAIDPAVQSIIVVEPRERGALERAMLFAPGLGETWIVSPDEVDRQLVARATQITAQRRAFRRARPRVEASLAQPVRARPERALISDAYLAELLRTVPEAIISIDDRDLILSWNPAAERLLGWADGDAIGHALVDRLTSTDPSQLEALLARGRVVAVTEEIGFRRRDGEAGTAICTVTPVPVEQLHVRSLILHDITERTRVAAQLREQTEALARANVELRERGIELEQALRARSRFYASMNHELRTPINAILGYIGLLLEGVYGPMSEPQVVGIQRTQRAARHLLELVNDVLDLAKIEAGRIEMEWQPVNVPSLVTELLDTLRPMADDEGSALRCSTDPARIVIRTDPRRVRQILLNLLSNAIKFGEGKPIDIHCARDAGGGAEVTVTDHGRGIAPEDLQRIFQEFVQLQAPSASGTGLGLAISRRLASLLGGSLDATSEVGEGSTFRLTLPAEPPE